MQGAKIATCLWCNQRLRTFLGRNDGPATLSAAEGLHGSPGEAVMQIRIWDFQAYQVLQGCVRVGRPGVENALVAGQPIA